MKRDPYKHKERFEKWITSIDKCKNIDGMSDINSKLFLSFIQDLRVGLNVSKSSKKGERSFIRLNTIRGKLAFIIKMIEVRGIKDIRNVTAKDLHNLFSDMRSGIMQTRSGTPYKSTGDYVKDFKTFWHWYQKIMKNEDKVIPDITEDLDTRGEKPKFVYFIKTDFENIQRGLIQKRRIYNDEPQGVGGILFNMRKPPFDDIRMRQAMIYLWDRTKLIENLFFNEYTYLDSYYPGGIYENPDNPIYRYDPDRAIELLAECGYKNRNEQGLLVNGEGTPLTFEMSFTAGMDRIFTVYQEDLRQVGIKLELKETTPATKFKMGHQRKFKMMYQNWTGLMFPNPETSWASWLASK